MDTNQVWIQILKRGWGSLTEGRRKSVLGYVSPPSPLGLTRGFIQTQIEGIFELHLLVTHLRVYFGIILVPIDFETGGGSGPQREL